MPYLTYAEFQEYESSDLTEQEFNNLLPKASGVLDSITRYFYQFNDIETDAIFRSNQFKKALSAQIAYFNDMGATSTHGLKEYGSVTIGRTTVSKGGRNSNQNDDTNMLISDDVYIYLSGTGLLYRGLAVKP